MQGIIAQSLQKRALYDTDASSENGCLSDQKQSYTDKDSPDDSRNALSAWCETFDGYGCRHDSHRAQIHDPDDKEDRHQASTAEAAIEAEAKAVSPSRAGIRRKNAVAPRCLPEHGR